MRVTFDDQIFASQSRGGISNYFVNLFQQFDDFEKYGVAVEGLPLYTKNYHLAEAGHGTMLRWDVLNRMPILRALNKASGSIRSFGKPAPPDVVHRTYYFDQRWPDNPGVRNVVTVHDMTPELFPEDFMNGNPHVHKKDNVYAADAIACVSETTKMDLLRLYPGISSPVIVTPLGVSPRFRPAAPSEAGANFFLYVGGRRGYKNFELLLQAFALVAHEISSDIVLVGGGPIDSEETNRFAELGLSHRVRQVNPTDSQLVELYQRAICFVFPSKYEGFGLPTLEAMASGCPTLLSETPALVEVGGDASIYFPLESPDGLAAKLIDMSNDNLLREGLRKRGLSRAADFAWTRTAFLTVECYQAALSR